MGGRRGGVPSWLIPFIIVVYILMSLYGRQKHFASSTYPHINLKGFEKLLRTTAPQDPQDPSSNIENQGFSNGRHIPLCPPLPEHSYANQRSLRQNSSFWSHLEDVDFDEKEIAHKFKLRVGGSWGPSECSPVHDVVIVVPYRDRFIQLKKFLLYMHPFLQKQFVRYNILVVEQKDELPFNRGKLINIGFHLAVKYRPNTHCFVFQDVDLLPESIYNIYACAQRPRHMSAVVNNMRYALMYPSLFGGAVAITKEIFESVNGFSNKYFGWGGEDDDLYERLQSKGIEIIRLSPAISSYRMLVHQKVPASNSRYEILNGLHNYEEDGLNNLDFSIVNHIASPLYTLVQVKL